MAAGKSRGRSVQTRCGRVGDGSPPTAPKREPIVSTSSPRRGTARVVTMRAMNGPGMRERVRPQPVMIPTVRRPRSSADQFTVPAVRA